MDPHLSSLKRSEGHRDGGLLLTVIHVTMRASKHILVNGKRRPCAVTPLSHEEVHISDDVRVDHGPLSSCDPLAMRI